MNKRDGGLNIRNGDVMEDVVNFFNYFPKRDRGFAGVFHDGESS